MTISLLVTALMLVPVRATSAGAVPSSRDKENYERLLAIILTGTDENKKVAKETLRNMGEVGIALLREDTKDIESVRGSLAWSLLKELLADSDKEILRESARRDLLDTAKNWNLTYTKGKADKSRQQRLQEIVSDYVNLLAESPKPKDFELLLKALKHSLITTGGTKADYGKEFDIWQKVWTLLGEKTNACDSAKVLEGWQKIIDEHFRAYSLRKDYVDSKTIQAYHSATLLLMQRLKALEQ
jgi:hypothetical protein